MKKFTDGRTPYPVTYYVPFFKRAYKKRFQSKIKKRMAYSVAPDETACNKPSHLDLYCMHR